jgi:glycosyltransferase involved in cell wall biosynthesis
MRIAVDASSLLARHPRGEGRTLLRLYQELARIRPDWSFVLFGTQAPEVTDEIRSLIPNSKICTFHLPGFRWNLWENIGLPLAAWRSGANLLHCASSGSPCWSPLPIVMTVHDVIPLFMDDGMGPKGVRRFRTRLMSGLRQSRAIISVSHHTKSDLILYTGVSPNKIKVVHWGVDSDSNSYSERPISKKVLGFGGGSIRKNTPAMVEMFAKVVAREPEAELIIVGLTDSTYHQKIESIVSQLGLQRKVNLMGYLTDIELNRLIKEAGCLVYISLYEGFGLPPLEVMVRGIPVVASNRSSIPEILGDACLLVDPEDTNEIAVAVLSVLQDRSIHRDLSEKAWHRARKFSWRKTAEQTAAIFEESVKF